MPAPIVIAYHLIWTAYGWWLPNDPRGSMSRFVASDLLSELGAVHFGRKHVQPARSKLLDFFAGSSDLLDHARLTFDAVAFQTIAGAFAQTIALCRYTCYGCAIMPDHVHLVIRKHKHSAEEMIWNLQRESRLLLIERGPRDREHPVWGGHGWKVFLDISTTSGARSRTSRRIP